MHCYRLRFLWICLHIFWIGRHCFLVSLHLLLPGPHFCHYPSWWETPRMASVLASSHSIICSVICPFL
jgi:hypothetical protein